MAKTTIVADEIGGSYSTTTVHATSAAGLVFVTGQVANRPESAPAGDPLAQVELGGLEEQTVRVMENIRAILEKAGTGFEHIVKRNVYITHASDFETVYSVMERYFNSPVASTGVITGLVPRAHAWRWTSSPRYPMPDRLRHFRFAFRVRIDRNAA